MSIRPLQLPADNGPSHYVTNDPIAYLLPQAPERVLMLPMQVTTDRGTMRGYIKATYAGQLHLDTVRAQFRAHRPSSTLRHFADALESARLRSALNISAHAPTPTARDSTSARPNR